MQVPSGFTPSAAPQPGAVPPPDPIGATTVTLSAPVAAAPGTSAPASAPAPEPAAAPPVAADPVTAGPVTAGPALAGPATAEPAPPVLADTFAGAAKTDLDKANVALDAVDKQAVQLDLDRQGVEDLLKLVSQARNLVDGVHAKAVSNLDIELKFGNNWVSEAISRRLREVAVGDESSAVNVIGDFMKVLFEVEETIRKAARNLQEADDEAADTFGSAGEARG
ncbi:hypothetical protein Q5530_04860 [Saccharothrix sp. BKS2]|uniref:hypothetical protein n=1 Tax=Saccharothrix sp. BKS2 TaxID=3064400 RepID=UPI0039E9C0E1